METDRGPGPVRAKAATAGAPNVRPVVSSAEALGAQLEYFELAVIGNAFHRLDRDLIAPAGWEQARLRRPDSQVLSDAGFELGRSHEFTIEHRWTLPGLAGLIRSTSFLPATVLGDQAAAFDADLAASLGHHSDDGAFTETVSFIYDLARKPD